MAYIAAIRLPEIRFKVCLTLLQDREVACLRATCRQAHKEITCCRGSSRPFTILFMKNLKKSTSAVLITIKVFSRQPSDVVLSGRERAVRSNKRYMQEADMLDRRLLAGFESIVRNLRRRITLREITAMTSERVHAHDYYRSTEDLLFFT